MSQVLVLSGATVTFRSLIEGVLAPEVVGEVLVDQGVSRLVIQYGNEMHGFSNKHLSQEFFDEAMDRLNSRLATNFEIVDDGKGLENTRRYINQGFGQFEIVAFPFSARIDQFIADSDVVLSHAGTGSILDCLRLEKPLVVVINDSLMHNHQEDVAGELQALGCCDKIYAGDLQSPAFRQILGEILGGRTHYQPLPAINKGALQSVIVEELANT